jgi:hypothetical protein
VSAARTRTLPSTRSSAPRRGALEFRSQLTEQARAPRAEAVHGRDPPSPSGFQGSRRARSAPVPVPRAPVAPYSWASGPAAVLGCRPGGGGFGFFDSLVVGRSRPACRSTAVGSGVGLFGLCELLVGVLPAPYSIRPLGSDRLPAPRLGFAALLRRRHTAVSPKGIALGVDCLPARADACPGGGVPRRCGRAFGPPLAWSRVLSPGYRGTPPFAEASVPLVCRSAVLGCRVAPGGVRGCPAVDVPL